MPQKMPNATIYTQTHTSATNAIKANKICHKQQLIEKKCNKLCL